MNGRILLFLAIFGVGCGSRGEGGTDLRPQPATSLFCDNQELFVDRKLVTEGISLLVTLPGGLSNEIEVQLGGQSIISLRIDSQHLGITTPNLDELCDSMGCPVPLEIRMIDERCSVSLRNNELIYVPNVDTDGDGLRNFDEIKNGSSVFNRDSDCDHRPDNADDSNSKISTAILDTHDASIWKTTGWVDNPDPSKPTWNTSEWAQANGCGTNPVFNGPAGGSVFGGGCFGPGYYLRGELTLPESGAFQVESVIIDYMKYDDRLWALDFNGQQLESRSGEWNGYSSIVVESRPYRDNFDPPYENRVAFGIYVKNYGGIGALAFSARVNYWHPYVVDRCE